MVLRDYPGSFHPVQAEEKKGATDLHSKFNIDIFKAGYTYSFFHDDRMNLSAGGGLYVMPIEIELETENEKIAEDISITAPLPVVMLNGEFAITPKWFLMLGMEVFYIEINDFTGSIFDVSAAIEYNAWKHVGLGLSVEFFDANVKAENKDAWPGADFIGVIDFELNGLMLYAKFYW